MTAVIGDIKGPPANKPAGLLLPPLGAGGVCAVTGLVKR
jgi:hypothetical protein